MWSAHTRQYSMQRAPPPALPGKVTDSMISPAAATGAHTGTSAAVGAMRVRRPENLLQLRRDGFRETRDTFPIVTRSERREARNTGAILCLVPVLHPSLDVDPYRPVCRVAARCPPQNPHHPRGPHLPHFSLQNLLNNIFPLFGNAFPRRRESRGRIETRKQSLCPVAPPPDTSRTVMSVALPRRHPHKTHCIQSR